jgi:hypothetical protein
MAKEFTYDVYDTVKRIHNNLDPAAVTSDAAKTIGTDNEFLLFKVFLDEVTGNPLKNSNLAGLIA